MPKYSANKFIKAIPGTGGVISDIADKIGCTWHTAKKYIDEYATVREAYEAERARITDKAHSNIIEAITKKRDLQTSKWYLSVKDPEFREKKDVNLGGADGTPIVLKVSGVKIDNV